MPLLSLHMLGTFQVFLNDAPLTDFHSNKVRALLAFLVVEADRPHERELLAGMLWPEDAPDQALTKLRQALHRLGQALEPLSGNAPLHTTRQAVQFNRALDYRLDVTEFMGMLALTELHRHRMLATCRRCIDLLRQAVSLYRGDFLAGFAGGESLQFEEWLLTWRERLRERYTIALAQLTLHHELRGEYEAAIGLMRRRLELEPWREEVHRHLMELLAYSGQRSAALAQFERCRKALATELATTPAPETLTLYRQIQTGDLPALPRRPGSLPAYVSSATPLVGREAELAQIADLLANPDDRLVTLVGPGGSGKTRLALAIAANESWSFADGVAFVYLAGVAAGDDPASEIARQCGGPAEHYGAPEQQLIAHMREREQLVVLDNFEQLVEQAGLLARLVRAAPRITLLVTSREPLHLEAERVLRVDGLAAPPQAALHSTGQQQEFEQSYALADYPATRLFLEAAQRARHDFSPDSAEQQAIIHICRLVEGMPLGIHLAAAQISHRPPSVIAAAIEQDLDTLVSPMRDTEMRHRSLRAVFDQSWQLLSPAEQHTLAYCALFRGGFDTTAALVICGGQAAPEKQPAQRCPILESLVDKSLVRHTESGRFDLHDLIRRFAAEDLERSGSIAAARARHSAFYLGLVASHADDFNGPDVRRAVTMLTADIDNIRAAWQCAIEYNDLQQLEAAARTLSDFYSLSGLYAEGAAAFGAAAERARSTASAEAARARFLIEHAHMLYPRGDYQPLIEAATEAIQVAHAAQLPLLEAAALVEWGKALWRKGDQQGASEQLQQAITLIQQSAVSDRAGLRLWSDALYYLGLSAWNQGALIKARAHYTEALGYARAIGYRYGEGDALNNLSLVALFQGAYGEAADEALQALDVYRAGGNRAGEGLGLISLGLAHMYRYRYAEAQAAYEQSLVIHKQIGDLHNTSIGHILLGMLATRMGDYAAAGHSLETGLALSRETEHRWGMSMALGYIGLLKHLIGEQTAGLEACRAALLLTEQIRDPVIAAYSYTHTGHILFALGDPAGAANAYTHALELRRVVGQQHLTVEPLAGLARVALSQEDAQQALILAEQILQLIELYTLQGAEEPFRIYLACYKALVAAGDARADDVLNNAYQALQKHITQLPNERIAHMFERVSAHRALVEQWQARFYHEGHE